MDNSPIRITSDLGMKMAEKFDEDIYQAVLSAGISVDKAELLRALQDQKTKVRIAEWLEVVKTFATQIAKEEIDRDKIAYICNYSWYRLTDDVKIPDDADKVKYYYILTEKEIDIYKDRDIDKEKAEWAARDERHRRQEEEREKWNEINDRHFDLRMEFVHRLSNSACKKALGEIVVFCAEHLGAGGGYYRPNTDKGTFAYCMGIKIEDPDNTDIALVDIPSVRDAINAFPEKAALCLAYSTADNYSRGYWQRDWDSATQAYVFRHKENDILDSIYNVLYALGYEMSDEEKQMQNGSYSAFPVEEGDDDAE